MYFDKQVYVYETKRKKRAMSGVRLKFINRNIKFKNLNLFRNVWLF